jgi:hypothetical protein
MKHNGKPTGDGAIVDEVIVAQLQHFQHTDPPCRGLQLPDGVLLRHTQSKALYFYLRTLIENGSIRTHVFASDSPYDRQKATIGVVSTPMFDAGADYAHLRRVEELVRSWVGFVKAEPDDERDFQTFNLDDPPR